MEDNLVDDLVSVADELRADLYASMGITQYVVYRVKRQWSGSERGEGTASVLFRTALSPTPLMRSVSERWRLEPHGRDEQGAVRLEEVSLTYTEEELTGGTLSASQEFYYEVVEDRGQRSNTNYFVLREKPSTDREKTIGWILVLEHALIKNP